MKPKTARELINKLISPLCSRDDHLMKFEPDSIHWREQTDQKSSADALEFAATTQPFEYQDTEHAVGSYYCGYRGCSVRYTPEQGYFTVVEVPEQPYFVDEPGTNTLACPIHNAWLYRRRRAHGEGFEWACGVDGCAYCHTDVPRPWLKQ
jgi:hypothetical protein